MKGGLCERRQKPPSPPATRASYWNTFLLAYIFTLIYANPIFRTEEIGIISLDKSANSMYVYCHRITNVIRYSLKDGQKVHCYFII